MNRGTILAIDDTLVGGEPLASRPIDATGSIDQLVFLVRVTDAYTDGGLAVPSIYGDIERSFDCVTWFGTADREALQTTTDIAPGRSYMLTSQKDLIGPCNFLRVVFYNTTDSSSVRVRVWMTVRGKPVAMPSAIGDPHLNPSGCSGGCGCGGGCEGGRVNSGPETRIPELPHATDFHSWCATHPYQCMIATFGGGGCYKSDADGHWICGGDPSSPCDNYVCKGADYVLAHGCDYRLKFYDKYRNAFGTEFAVYCQLGYLATMIYWNRRKSMNDTCGGGLSHTAANQQAHASLASDAGWVKAYAPSWTACIESLYQKLLAADFMQWPTVLVSNGCSGGIPPI